MLVVGDKEVDSGTVAPRFRDGKNLSSMKPLDFVEYIKDEVLRFN
jgi:threonyl-tRNA synthetase